MVNNNNNSFYYNDNCKIVAMTITCIRAVQSSLIARDRLDFGLSKPSGKKCFSATYSILTCTHSNLSLLKKKTLCHCQAHKKQFLLQVATSPPHTHTHVQIRLPVKLHKGSESPTAITTAPQWEDDLTKNAAGRSWDKKGEKN